MSSLDLGGCMFEALNQQSHYVDCILVREMFFDSTSHKYSSSIGNNAWKKHASYFLESWIQILEQQSRNKLPRKQGNIKAD